MTANEEETATVYMVQYSGGTNFKAAEMRRDELIGMGFDGYVVKIHGCYLVMAGAFENREDAYALRSEIREATSRMGHRRADHGAARLPAGLSLRSRASTEKCSRFLEPAAFAPVFSNCRLGGDLDKTKIWYTVTVIKTGAQRPGIHLRRYRYDDLEKEAGEIRCCGLGGSKCPREAS